MLQNIDHANKFQQVFLALIAGAGLTLAFAPFHWHLFALFCPALLLFLISHSKPWRAGIVGLLFGLAFYSTSVYWIYISIHEYGELQAWQALLYTSLFMLVLALFPAVQCALYAKCGPESLLKRVWLFPALWVMFEFFRSHLFSGFPWVLLGYSQTEGVLRSFAVIFGVYGVSFILCLCAGLIIHFYTAKRENLYHLIAIIAGIWLCALMLDQLTWVSIDNDPFKVTLVQGNINPTRFWTEEQVKESIDTYTEISKQHWDSDLIVWPENAIPIPYQDAQNLRSELHQFANEHDSAIIAGIPTSSEFAGFYYNSVIVLGRGKGHYHKRNLVPFGEYSPFIRQLFEVYRRLNIPLSTFMPGSAQQKNLTVKSLSVAPYICYEIAYSSTVLSDLPQANLLVTLNNDGWFGHSIASDQHLQIGQMRSIQTGRYQLFATNTGKTAIIDPKGRLLTVAPEFAKTSIDGIIYRVTGSTPWIWCGDYPMILISFLTMLYFLGTHRRRVNLREALNPIS